MNCSEEVQLMHHPMFLLPVFLSTTSSILSNICLVFLIKNYFFKLFWHLNFKILFFINIFISFSMSTIVISHFSNFFLRKLFEFNTCFVLVTGQECYTTRFAFLLSFVSITLNHAAIVIERLCATYKLTNYEKTNGVLGIFLGFITFIIGIIGVYFVLLFDDDDELLPTCFSFSATRVGDYYYLMLRVQFGVECLILFCHRWLRVANSAKKLQSVHTQEYLTRRFQRTENMEVLKQTNPLIVTCACFIGVYIIVASIIRIFRNNMTKNHYIIINFWIFIMPHMPFVLMIGSLFMLRKSHKRRISAAENNLKIETSHNQTFSNNFYDWDNAYMARHGIQKPITPRCVKNVMNVAHLSSQSNQN